MIRSALLAALLCLPALSAAAAPAAAPDIALYQTVLDRFVLDDGKVRYGALKRDMGALEEFVTQMAAVGPHSHPGLFPSREERLAYWINAYNALVLHAFAAEYPEKKDRLAGLVGRGLFFYKRKFTVGGEKRTLADIENETIRKEFGEPRIHFAIVCASASCPRLSRTAYTAANLEAQLESEAERFLNERRNAGIDRERRTVTLSKIFDWFAEDFGKNDGQVLRYVGRYNRQVRAAVENGSWRIRYFEYDWSPNDAPAPAPE